MKTRMKKILILLRPSEYVKNLFIFLPAFFAAQIADMELLPKELLAFAVFSALASAIYILNDFCDIEEDRQHPKKKHRPLASGDISKRTALFLMLGLAFVGILPTAVFLPEAMSIFLIYISINVIYSFWLKHIAILDIMIIAVSLVLRLLIGAAAANIKLSMWIVIMTFLLALFLALAKRRDDVLIFMQTGKKMRKAVDGYNLKLLDSSMAIMASVVIVVYILYTTSAGPMLRLHNEYLYLTVLFVIIGIMRYLQITFLELNSGSPTLIVLKDMFMQITIYSWVISFVWILYL